MTTFREYLQSAPDPPLAPSTIDVYVRAAKRWGDDPAAWFEGLRGRQATTYEGTRTVLVAAARHWYAWKGVEPGAGALGLRRRRRVNPTRDALDLAGLVAYQRAAAAAPQPYRAVLLLLPHTMLRVGEMCALPLTAVRKEGSTWALTVEGKGAKPRRVPLNQDALRALEAWLRVRPGGGPWLFPSPHGAAHPVHPGTVRAHLRALRGGAAWTPHVLRHTGASRLLAAGVPLRVIQEILGHTSQQTTLRYLHPDLGMMEAAVKKLEEK